MCLIPVQEALSVLTADFAISEIPFGAQLSFCCPVIGWRLRGIVRLSKALSAWSHHHSPEGSQYGPLSCEVQSLKGKGRKQMSSSSYLLMFQSMILPHCWPVVPILLWNASSSLLMPTTFNFPKAPYFLVLLLLLYVSAYLFFWLTPGLILCILVVLSISFFNDIYHAICHCMCV